MNIIGWVTGLHGAGSTIYTFAYRIKILIGLVFPDVGVFVIALPKGCRPSSPNQWQIDTPLFLEDSKGRGKVIFGLRILPILWGQGLQIRIVSFMYMD